MRRRCLICVLYCAVLAPAVQAQTTARLQFDATPPIAPSAPAYFSEQEATLDLRLYGFIPCRQFSAQLIQLSYRLEAELIRRPAFDCTRTPTIGAASGVDIDFQFVAPSVERVIRFEWRFATCDPADDVCEALLSVPFTAYPRDLLEPLKGWAARHLLVVRDPSGELQDFLDRNGIEFVQRPTGLTPETQVKTMLVERRAETEPAEYREHLGRGDVVLLREKTSTLPLVKSQELHGRQLTIVEFGLVARLPGSPAAQQVLLEILELSHTEEPIR